MITYIHKLKNYKTLYVELRFEKCPWQLGAVISPISGEILPDATPELIAAHLSTFSDDVFAHCVSTPLMKVRSMQEHNLPKFIATLVASYMYVNCEFTTLNEYLEMLQLTEWEKEYIHFLFPFGDESDWGIYLRQ